jgi:hypothetical protein
MLIEHTRSSFDIPLDSKKFPLLYLISQLACSLDMTVFSACYGFAAMFQYFQPNQKFTKCLKSVTLILSGLFISNMLCNSGSFREPPSIERAIEFLTFKTLYWDFLGVFPILLGLGYLITKPILNWLNLNKPGSAVWKLLGYTVLLVLPLLSTFFPNQTCNTTFDIYTSHFLGCLKRSPGTQRYTAGSFFFFFNAGAIIADFMITLDTLTATSLSASSTGKNQQQPNKNRPMTSPATTTAQIIQYKFLVLSYFGAWLIPCVVFFYELIQIPNRSWEYINYAGFRRFPMTLPIALAWVVLDLCAWALAYILGYVKHKKFPFSDILTIPIKFFEHLGSNVLLYFVINNMFINGMHGKNWLKIYRKTNLEWELSVIAYASLSIAATMFAIYISRTGRK